MTGCLHNRAPAQLEPNTESWRRRRGSIFQSGRNSEDLLSPQVLGIMFWKLVGIYEQLL